MGLRPARTIREAQGQQWARISTARPRKCYVKGAPRPKVRQYEMGTDKFYTTRVDLICEYPVHVRDNAVEAARQAANKYLEKTLLVDNYFFRVDKYPHLVIREHSALGVAGADRISKGMKRAFGKPKGRMMRVNAGDPLFTVYCNADVVRDVKVGLNRAKLKLSGMYAMKVSDISNEAFNLAKKGRAARTVKVKEEIKPVDATATAIPAAGATPAVPGAVAPAATGTAKEAGKEAKK
ncbi:MAG: 50S ribosomal protein L16 [Candidatus Micrarchaeota archaeon]|nr:50S ribosomal protein L16 [Candidatus Micrarchaeota archaeon]